MVVGTSGSVVAQSTTGFVGGGFVVSAQRAPGPADGSPSNLSPSIGGSAPGMVVTGGGYPSRWVGIAGELSLTGRIQTFQQFYHFPYGQGFDTRHRDVMMSALAHVGPHLRRMRPEAVGGLSMVKVDTLQAATKVTGFGEPISSGPYGNFEQVGRTSWAVTFGGDLAVAVSARVSVVPQIRVYRVARDYEERRTGLPRYIFRFGGGVRADF